MSNGLDIALMKDPFGGWHPELGDHHTDLAVAYLEWKSFFLDTLKVTWERYNEGEDIRRYDERYHSAFKESLRDFPLLARISDFYRDAFFAPGEIDQLEKELNRAAKLTLSDDGRAFLSGMSLGCRMAQDEKLGISLLSS